LVDVFFNRQSAYQWVQTVPPLLADLFLYLCEADFIQGHLKKKEKKLAKEWEVLTTSETYPWSFVTQIFHNGKPSQGVDRIIFEVMTSTLPKGIIGSIH
jgi:hypothetical protein